MHRDTSVNRGATLEVRLNEQLAVHQFYTLQHAGEPKPSAAQSRLAVETNAAIADDEVERIECTAQLDVELAHTTMFYRVLQGLLENAKEALRYSPGDSLRDALVLEVNLRFLALLIDAENFALSPERSIMSVAAPRNRQTSFRLAPPDASAHRFHAALPGCALAR
jgi:hypothetical protein